MLPAWNGESLRERHPGNMKSKRKPAQRGKPDAE
jgi:hypothetical protein